MSKAKEEKKGKNVVNEGNPKEEPVKVKEEPKEDPTKELREKMVIALLHLQLVTL